MKEDIIAWLCIFICGSSLVAAEAPSVRLTVHVITADGQPVSGIGIGVGGGLSTPDGQYPSKANGFTDTKGNFTATIACRDGIVGAFARGHGYYEAKVDTFRLYRLGQAGMEAKNAMRTGRWDPWERIIDVVIKPVTNPVPMYAKRVACLLPAKDAWLGYDLQKGDWLPPYGHGEQADFEFIYQGHVESNLNYDGKLSLRFPGAGNGIQAFAQDQTVSSEFRMPYEAPQDGYAASWSWRNARTTENKPGAISTFVDEKFLGRNFIFRVRSILDSRGNIIRANYGKIHGPFLLDPRGDNDCGYVEFIYYYNPDVSRNLEFDPKRNLFRDQNVRAP